MKRPAIVVVLSVLLAAAATASLGEVRVSFHYLEEERQRAMVEADKTRLEDLLDERCTYTHSTGLAQTRGELIAMLTSGSVDYLSIDTAAVNIAEYDGCAVVTGRQTIRLLVRGNPVTSVSRFTAVWADTDAGWHCVAYQSTPIPQEGTE